MNIKNETKPEKSYSDIINRIKDFLLERYEPVKDPRYAEFHLSTLQVYNELQRLLPANKKYKPADVAEWLYAAGFEFYDYGELHLDWMFKNKES